MCGHVMQKNVVVNWTKNFIEFNFSFVQEVKINKWDGSAVKHAIDDAVKNALLDRPNCSESFALVDGRLFICGLAVGIALVALAWDHLHPFPESR